MKKIFKKIMEAFTPAKPKTLGEMDIKQERSFEKKAKLKAIGIKARIFRSKHPELQGKATFDQGAVISSRFMGKEQSVNAKLVNTRPATAKNKVRVVHEGGVNYRAISVSQSTKDQLKQTLAKQNAAEQERLQKRAERGEPPIPMARIDKIVEEARRYAQNYKGIKVDQATLEVIEISDTGKFAEISVFDKHTSRPNAVKPVRPIRVAM